MNAKTSKQYTNPQQQERITAVQLLDGHTSVLLGADDAITISQAPHRVIVERKNLPDFLTTLLATYDIYSDMPAPRAGAVRLERTPTCARFVAATGEGVEIATAHLDALLQALLRLAVNNEPLSSVGEVTPCP